MIACEKSKCAMALGAASEEVSLEASRTGAQLVFSVSRRFSRSSFPSR